MYTTPVSCTIYFSVPCLNLANKLSNVLSEKTIPFEVAISIWRLTSSTIRGTDSVTTDKWPGTCLAPDVIAGTQVSSGGHPHSNETAVFSVISVLV